ncbi:MAG: hypothetical protein ABI112_06200 [Terracoccus sp.]
MTTPQRDDLGGAAERSRPHRPHRRQRPLRLHGTTPDAAGQALDEKPRQAYFWIMSMTRAADLGPGKPRRFHSEAAAPAQKKR